MSLGRQESHDIRNYNTGITRKKDIQSKEKNKFIYYYIKNGKEVSPSELKRIMKLGLPPAWENVWISADPISSIQAIGQDDQGRKQYKYHELHIKKAEQEKFLRLYKFIKAMPKLEKSMKEHSTSPSYSKNKVIVTMLTLVNELYIRVGKETYAQSNKSYGISSLRKKHIKLKDNAIHLKFKGKSGVRTSYTLKDKEIHNHIKELLKIGGDKLFQYISDSGRILPITDVDLNDYVRNHMGKEFTVKDFRTYSSNYLFIKALLRETKKRSPKNEKIIKKNILKARKHTATALRHTLSISKKSYVMAFATELYQNNPDFFIANKDKDANQVLLNILKLYKQNVLHI